MEQEKVYISGQITRLKPEEYEPLFYTAENQLKANGYEVINPLRIAKGIAPELIDPKTHTEREIWRTIVKADITELMKCEAIYMLSNWELSEKATLEHSIAEGLGLRIEYETEPHNTEIKAAIKAVMGVPFKILAQDSRNRWHVYARMIYAHHCKKAGDNTGQIATETKHDESSIGYYLRHYESEYKYNREFRNAAEKVATLLSSKLKNAERHDY